MVMLLFQVEILIIWGFSQVGFFWSSPRELQPLEITSLLALYVAFVSKLLEKRKIRPKTFAVLELWSVWNKPNDVREDGIVYILQSKTRKVNSSKTYHPDVTSDSVTDYFCKHQNSLGFLKVKWPKGGTFLDKGFDNSEKVLSKLNKHKRTHCFWALPTKSGNLL